MARMTKTTLAAFLAAAALGAGAPSALAQSSEQPPQSCDQSFNGPAPGTGPEWQTDPYGPEWQADQPGTGPEWQTDPYGPEWNSGVPCSNQQPGEAQPTPPEQQSAFERALDLPGKLRF